MLIVICIAGAAALAVVAYGQLQSRSPEAGTAGLKMVRELAAVVLVCTKAVEGVVDVLAHRVQPAPAVPNWGYRSSYRDDEDDR